ncbi:MULTISPECIES: glycosyltransferase family 117 protein [unclassified Flavobacterium]|uniref:glycosyltransferase family 117 protein n=1 Tax=unclassified Flavobacterium TaxID=196869 RepID=UPI003F919D1B
MNKATFNFNKWNTILGWITFGIALLTYTLTVEPTMSFWDCGEYIATAAKLEVGHPPGAPLFQMIGAFFAMFASDDQHIALMVNMTSVFSSAFTILFLFWSSSMILRKLVAYTSELNKNNEIVILGSSFVGALAFTYSDSFWFNAVEAEVYAMASLLIALLLWLGLRWEQEMNTARGDRWLLIISLVVGLSFGVHFMALLTIPAIGFLYFFKNYKTVTIKNFIIANVVVISILLFIFKLLLPLTMAFFGKTEIFMVNSFGLPFNSGTIFVTLVLIAFFYFGLRYTRNKGMIQYNTLLLCILFILIGFSTWMMLPIRANANTVINENKPSDAAEVLAYYNREQYGVNPLFYGPQYTETFAGLDKENPYLDKAPNYERDYKTGKYVIVNNFKNAEQNSDDSQKTILPRMWSADHIENYMNFTNAPEFRLNPNYPYEQDLAQYGIDVSKLSEEDYNKAIAQLKNEIQKTVNEFRQAYAQKQIDNEGYMKFLKSYSDYLIIEKPTTIDNLSFMFEYQFGYMYWRYLMWNFVGRQNDIQGRYSNQDGNWISGIKFIDNLHLGSQDNLPSDVLNNKGRNVYFFLPFILGLIGLMYHASKDRKSFYVLLSLFLFTGIALKIYLNERPFEPRERDYALVGSFYVFAIWIGFGVYALYETAKNYLAPKIAGPIIITASLLAAPILMGYQNWDDHDRSGKYTATAMAKAYLESCDPNAILFTIGDNDTFPLWYAQEIEKIRTDVKIVNTSLFMTDWYIDQMKTKTYESEALPISFSHSEYVGDKLDYVVHIPKTESRWEIKDFLAFIKNPKSTVGMQNGQTIHFYPTNKVRIPVDKNTIIKNKVVSPKYNDSIVPYIDIDIKGNALYKNRLMMLDIVANNNWKRPIYFSGGAFDNEDYLWMKDYLQLDGLVYKLVPVRTAIPKNGSPLDMGQIDTDKMYANIMKWDWGNSDSDKIYHDPETRRESITYRTNLARLMEQLIKEDKEAKAKEIINLAMTKMPIDKFYYYSLLEPFADGYYKVGEKAKAQDLLNKLMQKYKENLNYYKTLDSSEQSSLAIDIITDIERYRGLLDVMKTNADLDFYNKNKTVFNTYIEMFKRFGRERE